MAEFVNKVVYGDETLIDLTQDDVLQSDVLAGKYVHLPSGERVQGTCDFDANTTEANAPTASEILEGKKAWANATELTGTMPNIGKQSIEINNVNDSIKISAGYHDGTGSAGISDAQKALLIPENIKQGVNVLGVEGAHSGSEDVKATSASVTPKTTAQTIAPSDYGDYNYISQIEVSPIAYNEVDNPQGGKTVTIGTV